MSGAASAGMLSSTLRTHTSAAPLKRSSGRGIVKKGARSPHSHECGSVEAAASAATSAKPASSPHSHECGSVEAYWPKMRFSSVPTLRTHTSAAPLKPECLAVLLQAAVCSPHSHECGSVEAAVMDTFKPQIIHSPHSHECGSVEARPMLPWQMISGFSPHSHECGSVEAPSARLHLSPIGVLSALTRVRLR